MIDHPYRDGATEGDWWWFDAMHYRKTGKFTEAMLEATRDMSSPHHLYALGYLTHVAADTVGHAYVNLYCGGPYRSQAQRHKTGENFQDVFNLLEETGVDFNYSKLHALYNFNFAGVISARSPPRTRRCRQTSRRSSRTRSTASTRRMPTPIPTTPSGSPPATSTTPIASGTAS